MTSQLPRDISVTCHRDVPGKLANSHGEVTDVDHVLGTSPLRRSNGSWKRARHDKQTLAHRKLVTERNREVADFPVSGHGVHDKTQ